MVKGYRVTLNDLRLMGYGLMGIIGYGMLQSNSYLRQGNMTLATRENGRCDGK